MDARLARTLVQRGVIRQGTVIEAYQSARGLSCVCDSYTLTTYKVLAAKATKETVTFEAIAADKLRYRVPCEYVQTLDGMQVARVAASHRLTETGDEIIVKRGRRSESC